MENGEWRTENGERRMENGEWRMENEKWRMENGKAIPTSNFQFITLKTVVILSHAKQLFNSLKSEGIIEAKVCKKHNK